MHRAYPTLGCACATPIIHQHMHVQYLHYIIACTSAEVNNSKSEECFCFDTALVAAGHAVQVKGSTFRVLDMFLLQQSLCTSCSSGDLSQQKEKDSPARCAESLLCMNKRACKADAVRCYGTWQPPECAKLPWQPVNNDSLSGSQGGKGVNWGQGKGGSLCAFMAPT